MPKKSKTREPQITLEQIDQAKEKLKEEFEAHRDTTIENVVWWLGEEF